MERDDRLVERLRALAPEERRAVLDAEGEAHVRALDCDWGNWVRVGQAPPPGEWTVWVMMAGRGFGKTRAGAEWVSQKAREHPGAKIALVAATPEEARRVMIEGRGGLFAAARDGEERRLMRWEPGLGRLTFASGAEAWVYSGADGESLRGAEHHFAWCDELAKWKRAQAAWDNLMMGLRAGEKPQVVVTTTPRSVPTLRAVLDGVGVVRSGGRTIDNPHNAPAFVEWNERTYGGTLLGRQELLGELLEDVEGALFRRELLEKARVKGDSYFQHGGTHPRTAAGESNCPLQRVVIGVDPPVSAAGDACGIVACGMGFDGIAYVLADHSAAGLSPEQWARKVAGAAERWAADRVVAEGNQGGEMVAAVLRGAGLRLPVKIVHARVGKTRRAEPIVAFFESGEAKLAGRFPELEDELAGLQVGGGYAGPGRSPDRADAAIWALTELLLAPQPATPRITRL